MKPQVAQLWTLQSASREMHVSYPGYGPELSTAILPDGSGPSEIGAGPKTSLSLNDGKQSKPTTVGSDLGVNRRDAAGRGGAARSAARAKEQCNLAVLASQWHSNVPPQVILQCRGAAVSPGSGTFWTARSISEKEAEPFGLRLNPQCRAGRNATVMNEAEYGVR